MGSHQRSQHPSPGPSRRRLGLAVGGVAGALGLAACGVGENREPPGPDDGTATGDISLRASWWGGALRSEQTQKALDAFREEHANINLTGEYSDWSGYWDRLATAAAGGNAADVLQMDVLYLSTYADTGVLVALDDAQTLDLSKVDPKVVDLGRVGGTLYALPAATNVFAVMVNMDLLSDLGISLPDTDSWTWDEYEEFATAISDEGSGEVYGTSLFGSQHGLTLWARQNGESLFDESRITVSEAVVEEFMRMSLDWTRGGAAASASHQAEMGSVAIDQGDFSTGKQAMNIATSNQISAYIAASDGADMQLVQLPTLDANATRYQYQKASMYWSVASSCDNPVDAAGLINFLVNDPAGAKYLLAERGTPINSDVLAAVTPLLETGDQLAAAFVTKVAENVGESPVNPPNGTADFESVLSRHVQDVTFGEATPQEAAEAFISEIQVAIDQA